MEHDKDGSSFGDGSDFAGAIFMCNTATRDECFRRKLFGLPSNMAHIVKKIKAGMFLFLFDHEERKLFGVFEATTDGAMNIVPAAYSGFGSFPAQVRFSNLWNCRPLRENEFEGAIKNNYYAPKKFHFNLSSKQVGWLIQLFYSKKISSSSNCSYNKANPRLDHNGGAIKRARSARFDTLEHHVENNADLRSGLNAKRSMYNQSRDPTYEDPDVGSEYESYPILPRALQENIPNSRSSPSQFIPVFQENVHVSPLRRRCCHIEPRFEGEHPYDALDPIRPNLSRNLAPARAPNLRNHLYRSNLEPHELDYPTADYRSPVSHNLVASHEPTLTRMYPEPLLPHHGNDSYSMQPSYETFHLPSTDNSSLVPRTHGGLLPQNESFNGVRYRSSSPKFYTAELVPYLHGSINGLGSREASLEFDNARQSRYWKPHVSLAEDENLVTSEEPQLPSFYSSDPCIIDDYQKEGGYYYSQDNEQYPDCASPEIADSSQKKTSVFSRLSKPHKSNWQKDRGSIVNTSDLDLLRLLSQRKKQWIKMEKAPKKPFSRENEIGNKRLMNQDLKERALKKSFSRENGIENRSMNQDLKERALKKSFSRENDIENRRLMNQDLKEAIVLNSFIELDSDSTVAEECQEPPFLNFKRRSEAKIEEGEIRESSVEECVKEKCKRRKLIRPSFTESNAFTPNFNENKQLSLFDVDPKDLAEGSVVSGKGGAGTLPSSKDNGTDVLTADAKAEKSSVEYHLECSKISADKLRVAVGNDSLALEMCELKNNASNLKNAKGPNGNSSVDFGANCDSHKTEGIGDHKEKAFGDINENNEISEEASLICRADQGSECEKLDEVYEKIRLLINHRKGKMSEAFEKADCLKENAVTSQSGIIGDIYLLPFDHEVIGPKVDSVCGIKDTCTSGNAENIENPDSALLNTIPTHVQETKRVIVTANEGRNEGFLTKMNDHSACTGNARVLPLRARTKLTELSFLKSKAQEVKESQDINC